MGASAHVLKDVPQTDVVGTGKAQESYALRKGAMLDVLADNRHVVRSVVLCKFA